MKIVIAIDSFKGSLTTWEAGEAVKRGIQNAWKEAEVIVKPLADGGEGTVDAVTAEGRGEKRTVTVMGPLGEPVEAVYGILKEKHTAVLEAAAAVGLTLIPKEKRNPMETTSYGMGELLGDAIEQGCREFIIGIGGTGSNDCGIGMLSALGWRFLDGEGKEVPLSGKGLAMVEKIEDAEVLPVLKECRFRIACDVTNPLCGENGSSYVFAPQKGATPEMVRALDEGCRHFSDVVKRQYGREDAEKAGVGAAGGMGYAFVSFLNGELGRGIDLVLSEIDLKKELADADFLVTGEGRLDGQTAMGKAPAGAAALGKECGCIVLALGGGVTEEASACHETGMDALFSIQQGVLTQEEAMEKKTAARNAEREAEQLFRLIRAVKETK